MRVNALCEYTVTKVENRYLDTIAFQGGVQKYNFKAIDNSCGFLLVFRIVTSRTVWIRSSLGFGLRRGCLCLCGHNLVLGNRRLLTAVAWGLALHATVYTGVNNRSLFFRGNSLH